MSVIQAADEAAACHVNGLDIVLGKGRLIPLKTKDELRAAFETIDAYAIAIPAKHAGIVLNVVRVAVPNLNTINIQHLRRVVQLQYLPEHIQQRFNACSQARNADPEPEKPILNGAIGSTELRYLLISPTSLVSLSTLVAALAISPPFVGTGFTPEILTIPVPALAPTSAEQAAQWSRDYWPISYKNTNPYGPHPSLVARNTADIEGDAGTWLGLAQLVGREASDARLGENVGCIIVDKTKPKQEVIAAAGDARWCSSDGKGITEREGPGNVMAHAVIRAIAMVANKRLRVTAPDDIAGSGSGNAKHVTSPVFCDGPLTPLEKRFHVQDNISSNGYLCVDLDIYVSHEPCIMCSMAILHSRFRRCVFGRRMPLTGGLTAELSGQQERADGKNNEIPAGLGYGIFWRPSELNWKFLAWEWEEDDHDNPNTEIKDTLQI